MARILDGTFSFVGDLVEVISAPEWSMDALERMRIIIDRHQTGGATLDDVIDAIKAIAPHASDGLLGWIKTHGVGLLGIIIPLLIYCLTQAENVAEQEIMLRDLDQKDRLIGMLEQKLEQQTCSVTGPEEHNRPVANKPLRKSQPAPHAQHPNRKSRRIAKSNTRPKPRPDWMR